MYPRQELTILAARKAALLDLIAARREVCADAAARAARPLEIIDGGIARWRRLSPLVKFAAIPLGLLLKRSLGRRARMLGGLMRWGPIVVGAVRGFAGARGFSRRG
jgi:hypothetical protein